jgi:hypothetical protein
MTGGNDDVGLRADRRYVLAKLAEIGSIRPRHNERWHSRTVRRWHAGRDPADGNLIGGVAAYRGDTGRIGSGLVIARPVHRAALHGGDAQTVAGDDGGSARCGKVGASSGMCDADLIKPSDRGRDALGAVIDIVGDAHGVDAGKPQGFTANLRIGKKTFGRVRPLRWQMKAAFEIGEHGVGRV